MPFEKYYSRERQNIYWDGTEKCTYLCDFVGKSRTKHRSAERERKAGSEINRGLTKMNKNTPYIQDKRVKNATEQLNSIYYSCHDYVK